MSARQLCPRCRAANASRPAIPVASLTPVQRRLIGALAASPGKVVPYSDIVDAVWGHDPEGGPLDAEGNVHVQLFLLRRRLAKAGIAGVKIVAHPGRGYELVRGDG
jgi:DNA-binding response OmpR family regulator